MPSSGEPKEPKPRNRRKTISQNVAWLLRLRCRKVSFQKTRTHLACFCPVLVVFCGRQLETFIYVRTSQCQGPKQFNRFNLPPLDLNQRYSIPETNAYLRQSNAKTYKDIREGKLKAFKDGRRTYVSGHAIAARSA